MISCTPENISTIYNHIQNDYSKKIFTNTLLYSLTGDIQYKLKNVDLFLQKNEDLFLPKLRKGNKNLIFGAGRWGRKLFSYFAERQNVCFECFIDNNVKSSLCDGLPVFSFKEYISRYKNETILIAARYGYEEIYEQLKTNGVADSNIINAGKIIDRAQYFDLQEFKEKQANEEVFVDAGCCNGNTSLYFLEWAGSKAKKIYAFEPDAENAVLCEKNISAKINAIQNNRGGGLLMLFVMVCGTKKLFCIFQAA